MPGSGFNGVAGGELQETKTDEARSTKVPTMHEPRSLFMALILLEALLALIVLLLIVWWTMFSGRKKGELVIEEQTKSQVEKKEPEA